MRILLDTHVYLWSLLDAPDLPASFASAIRDRHAHVFVSAVCVWEATIKHGLGRLDLGDEVDLVADITASGFEELPVTADHAAATSGLPPIHTDPFDRLLVAQALEDRLHLATVDATVRCYPDVTLLPFGE